MAKPTTHDHGAGPAYAEYFDVDEIHIAAWCPDPLALTPPTQVHMALKIRGLDAPVACRFKGPDTLGVIIDQLIRYRDTVWPAAASSAPIELEPSTFPEVTNVLHAPEGEPDVGSLPVAQIDGVVVSRWQLPESARSMLAKGASVWLLVMGKTQPPVSLLVSKDGPFTQSQGADE